MTSLPPTPLFDEVARDGHQQLLAHIIRRATRIRPLGPNSRAVHEAGGAVNLTPAEAEEAARAVLLSGWFQRVLNDAVNARLAELTEDDEEFCPKCHAGTESPEHFEKCGGA